MSKTEVFFRELAWRLNHAEMPAWGVWMNEHPRAAALGMAVFFVLGNVWCGGFD